MNDSPSKITGILLAGGESRRMGREKGMIPIGKLLMYQYPLKVLETLCDEILISTCKQMNIEEDYEQVCDEIRGIGPIGGIYTCLKKSSNELNIVLSYDLPLIRPELFEELLKSSGNFEVVLPSILHGEPEPLCGIYKKSTAAVFKKMIDENEYAIHRIATRTNTNIVPIDPRMPFFHPDLFLNVNRDSDLEMI